MARAIMPLESMMRSRMARSTTRLSDDRPIHSRWWRIGSCAGVCLALAMQAAAAAGLSSPPPPLLPPGSSTRSSEPAIIGEGLSEGFAAAHTPGTYCYTPVGWCVLTGRGPVGHSCQCKAAGSGLTPAGQIN